MLLSLTFTIGFVIHVRNFRDLSFIVSKRRYISLTCIIAVKDVDVALELKYLS